ncbi:MAG: DUF5074 domain-containing protein [Bacteroidia bacterium]
MINKLKIYFLFTALTLTFFSCRKDAPPTLTKQGSISASKRLLICDEGAFGFNEADISIYDPETNATIIKAYASANSNQNLGDVLQSVTKYNDNYYLVVNNSGKVVVCDKNFKRLSTISGFISPRYMQVVSNNKAYVSNFVIPTQANQTNYIQVVDINANIISKSIRIYGWTEEMVQSYGKVYIANQYKNYVYVIDASNDKLDSIFVGATSACIVKDENEKIWVSCNADAAHNINAKLVKINPLLDSVEATISLNTTQNSISHLCINGAGNTLYYLMNDVFKMDIGSTTGTNIIQQGTRSFYGLCIDPNDETIYVSDPGNFNANGKLYRYQNNYKLIGTYSVSIGPGTMLFD